MNIPDIMLSPQEFIARKSSLICPFNIKITDGSGTATVTQVSLDNKILKFKITNYKAPQLSSDEDMDEEYILPSTNNDGSFYSAAQLHFKLGGKLGSSTSRDSTTEMNKIRYESVGFAELKWQPLSHLFSKEERDALKDGKLIPRTAFGFTDDKLPIHNGIHSPDHPYYPNMVKDYVASLDPISREASLLRQFISNNGVLEGQQSMEHKDKILRDMCRGTHDAHVRPPLVVRIGNAPHAYHLLYPEIIKSNLPPKPVSLSKTNVTTSEDSSSSSSDSSSSLSSSSDSSDSEEKKDKDIDSISSSSFSIYGMDIPTDDKIHEVTREFNPDFKSTNYKKKRTFHVALGNSTTKDEVTQVEKKYRKILKIEKTERLYITKKGDPVDLTLDDSQLAPIPIDDYDEKKIPTYMEDLKRNYIKNKNNIDNQNYPVYVKLILMLKKNPHERITVSELQKVFTLNEIDTIKKAYTRWGPHREYKILNYDKTTQTYVLNPEIIDLLCL